MIQPLPNNSDRRSILICPSYFDGRMDGIGRVGGAFGAALAELDGVAPYVLSSNEPAEAIAPADGQGFGGGYASMLLRALTQRRRGAIQRIVCTHLGLSPVARLLAHRYRVPYTVFVHGIEAWRPLPARSRWGLRGATRIFTNSVYTRERFQVVHPWSREIPTEVVPLGVSLLELSSGEMRNRRQGDGFRLLCVGRMASLEVYEDFKDRDDLYKGYKVLVDAVGLLMVAGVVCRLDLVGDGNARPGLESWVRSRPAAAAVVFRGRVNDAELNQIYSESDVFCLPSEGEGFGLVFAEAMAHGLPCVAVAAGAAPEVVDDGVTGFVARPRDASDLADRLLVLARNPRLRERMSSAALERSRSRFGYPAFRGRILAALRVAEPRLQPCVA